MSAATVLWSAHQRQTGERYQSKEESWAQRQSSRVAQRENKLTKLWEVEKRRSLPSNYKPVSRPDRPGIPLLLLPLINIHQTVPEGAPSFLSEEMTHLNIIYLLSSFIPSPNAHFFTARELSSWWTLRRKLIIHSGTGSRDFTGFRYCELFLIDSQITFGSKPHICLAVLEVGAASG